MRNSLPVLCLALIIGTSITLNSHGAADANASANKPVSTTSQITTLDQLLAKVKLEHEKEKALNAQREAEFLRDRDKQQQLLDKARSAFYQAQAKSAPTRAQADANEGNHQELPPHDGAEEVQPLVLRLLFGRRGIIGSLPVRCCRTHSNLHQERDSAAATKREPHVSLKRPKAPAQYGGPSRGVLNLQIANRASFRRQTPRPRPFASCDKLFPRPRLQLPSSAGDSARGELPR